VTSDGADADALYSGGGYEYVPEGPAVCGCCGHSASVCGAQKSCEFRPL